MKKGQKGQTALEYLVTYGWAILAIVIIAGVLWYFGVFNPSRFVEERTCGGSTRFACLDYKVDTAGTLTIVLGNKGGTSITINGTTPLSSGCVGSSISSDGNFTCTAASFVPAGPAGSSFDQKSFQVTFVDRQTALSHTDSVFVKGKYEAG